MVNSSNLPVLLFPDRPRRRRDVIALALLLSLLVHLVAGGVIARWGERLAGVVARMLPIPTPKPEEVAATSDVITLERKHPVPREMHRTPPHAAPQRVAVQQPQRVAQVPAPLARSVPTPMPLPTLEPTSVPTYTPVRGTIHHPQAAKAKAPRQVAQAQPVDAPPDETPVRGAKQPSNRLSSAQIAALESQMREAIAQTHVALNDVPRQHEPPHTMKSYKLIMAGTLDDVQTAQGHCHPIEERTPRQNGRIGHIMNCDFLYRDGYVENVTIPWYQWFDKNDDPPEHPWKLYAVQGPPPGPAPNPLNFSRMVCIFYRAECKALIERENANGGNPAPG